MSNANSPYSGGDTPDLFTGLNAGQVDGCDVSSSASLGTSDTLIPTQGAAKAYVDSRIANHSTNHTDLYYTQTQVDSMLGGYSIEDYGDITDTPTGIIEATDITVAWDNSTKGVTITPAAAATYVWARGVKHLIDVAGETIVGDGTHYTLAQGLWYYYYDQNLAGDDLELNASQTFPGMAVAIVAMGYYDADTHTVSAHDYLSSATSTVKIHEIVKCVTGSLPATTDNGDYFMRLTSNLGSTDLSLIDVTDGNWVDVTAYVADVAYPNMLGNALYSEGHTTKISPEQHQYHHTYDGLRWKSGFAVYKNAKDAGAPTGDKESRIAVQGGTLANEDLEYIVANDDTPDADFDQDLGGATDAASETNPALLPVMYLDGTKWKMTKPQPWAFHHGGTTTRPYYNSISSGSGLTQATSAYFIPYFICATNHVKYPLVLVMGQNQYSSRDAAKIDPRTMSWGATNFAKEIKVLWRIIVETKSAFSSATHYAVIREVADFRANNGSVLTFSASNDHSALTNLGFDASRHYGFQRATTLSTSEPGVTNDDDDTAALGNRFFKGDFWLETDDKQIFVCMDNAAGAADWDEVLTSSTSTWTTQTGKIATSETDIAGLKKENYGKYYGLTLSNAADTEHDITIAAGTCIDSTYAYVMTLASAITKQIDTAGDWTAGTNQRGLDTGSVAASTEYFVWLIRKDSDGTIDALISASSTAPTMPAGYTYKRLLRGVRTDSSSNIVNNQWLITDVVNDRAANLIVCEEQAANTQGGSFTNGAWRTRTLNTVKINEIPGASLATNQITLPAGQYKILATLPSNYVSATKARLYNITLSSDLIIGPSNFNEQHGVITVTDILMGSITLSATTVIELQHRCLDSYNTYGLGRASNLDSKVEVYSQIEIVKIG